MMSKKSISFGFIRFGLLLVFLIQMVCLSAKKIQVHGLPHINQLPTHIINTVFQDSQGYIWYGTQDAHRTDCAVTTVTVCKPLGTTS